MAKTPKKIPTDELRQQYFEVTGKGPAIRWTRTQLQKNLRDARLLTEADAADEASVPVGPQATGPKADFERLASGGDPEEAEQAEVAASPVDGRGGYRPGAGKPKGQTHERYRIEQLIALQVPDLGVLMFVRGLNTAVGRMTGVPFDKAGCKDIALGLTQMVLYWFPSLEGRTGPISLHLTAVGLMWAAAEKRSQQIQETRAVQNDTEKKASQDPEQEKGGKNGDGKGRVSTKRPGKPRSHTR